MTEQAQDPTQCEKSPNGHHDFVYSTGQHISQMLCRWCRQPAAAGARPADPSDRWARHD